MKGQHRCLALGDIVSLTKPIDELGGGDLPPRVQFRLDFQASPEELAGTKAACVQPLRQPVPTTDVPATSPDAKIVEHGGLGTSAPENCFAQDLLVQEQQSKAKITAQLLQSQSKLEEEKQAAEAASRELDKIRKQVAEERARRHEAEESRDRLSAEAETLRTEHRQLKELRTSHEELKQRHEVVQAELKARQQKCAQLETSQEQLRKDLEKAMESHQKASQQHAELQTRARQAQERSDRLQQQYEEAKREADWTQEQCGRLESELTTERKARQELEEQVAKTKDQVGSAEASERTAREALDAATAKRAELECQASSAHSDMEAAKAAARQAQQRLTASKQLVDRLHEASHSLSAELKRRAEVWENALKEGNFDGLEDALASGGPTFAQVTCQVESPPAKSSQDEVGDANGNGHEAQTGAADEAAGVPHTVEPGDLQVSEQDHRSEKLSQVFASSPAIIATAPTSISASTTNAALAEKLPATSMAVEEVAIDDDDDDDDDDDLLAAAARDPVEQSDAGVAAPAAASDAPASAPLGCSTAWSLEVLDAASAGDLTQPAKRMRLNGE
jgi:myosin heavy subunit